MIPPVPPKASRSATTILPLGSNTSAIGPSKLATARGRGVPRHGRPCSGGGVDADHATRAAERARVRDHDVADDRLCVLGRVSGRTAARIIRRARAKVDLAIAVVVELVRALRIRVGVVLAVVGSRDTRVVTATSAEVDLAIAVVVELVRALLVGVGSLCGVISRQTSRIGGVVDVAVTVVVDLVRALRVVIGVLGVIIARYTARVVTATSAEVDLAIAVVVELVRALLVGVGSLCGVISRQRVVARARSILPSESLSISSEHCGLEFALSQLSRDTSRIGGVVDVAVTVVVDLVRALRVVIGVLGVIIARYTARVVTATSAEVDLAIAVVV